MRKLLAATAMAAVAVLASGTSAQAVGNLQTVASPNVAGSDYNELDGVAPLGPVNAWAVGFTRPSSSLAFRTLVEHWNGTSWAITGSATLPAANDTRLHAVAAVSSTNIWAVGSNSVLTSTGSISHTLIEHWNGASWSVVPSPAAEPSGGELVSLTAVSANDIWAVGDANPTQSGFNTLIEHWNGAVWNVVPGAALSSTSSFLLSVAAAATNDVWAVGRINRHSNPIIEHWDGTSWTLVSQPVNGFDSALNSVSVVSGTDVWAVGEQGLNQTVTEHWDGTGWTLVPSPSSTANGAQDTLRGVVALGNGDVWAVGNALVNSGQEQTLALHWDGTSWQLVNSTNPSSGSNQLSTVAGTAPGQPLWAAGFSTSGGTPQFATLVETTTG